jgi:ribonuclease P protein component
MGLPRGQRIRRPEEFRRVTASGRRAADSLLSVAAARHSGDGPQFGLSVSKRVVGAAERNRVKRRLREALRSLGLSGPWSVVVTARPAALSASFSDLRESLARLIARAGVVPGTGGRPGSNAARRIKETKEAGGAPAP